MARGMGMFGMGAGMYNVDTAQARSINANTAMRWDQGMFNGSREGAKLFMARVKKQAQDTNKSYSEIQDRIKNNPTDSRYH